MITSARERADQRRTRGTAGTCGPIGSVTPHAWAALAADAGFAETERLASVPSRFLGSIYAASSLR